MNTVNVRASHLIDDQIRRLEQELWQARYDIIALMPDPIFKLLQGFHGCRSHTDYGRWQRNVIDQIVALAKPDVESSYLQNRGNCPLCNRGSLGPYAQGFSIPLGLSRHLEGWGNTQICPVTRAAFQLAQDALKDAFRETSEAEGRTLLDRRRTETTYFTSPNCAPELWDENSYSPKIRNQQTIEFAEARLENLGFSREEDRNIVTYKLIQEPYIVLADIRSEARINFVVFGSKKSKGRYKTAHFYMLDSWKNDVSEKFKSRLLEATISLFPKNSCK